MAESTLSVDYGSVFREVARYIGAGAVYSTGTIAIASGVVTLTSGTFPSWAASGTLSVSGSLYTVNTRDSGSQVTLDDTSITVSSGASYVLVQAEESEATLIEDSVQSGYRNILYPHFVEGVPQHAWSWLQVSGSLSLTSADYDIDLPDDFTPPIIEASTLAANSGKIQLQTVSEGTLRSMLADSTTSGVPRYVAVDNKTFAPTTGQRWQALVYPPPDGSYTLTYNYLSAPGKLTATNKYPFGGMVVGEMLIKAAMAQAEFRMENAPGVHQAAFAAALKSAILRDIDSRSDDTTYEATAVSYGIYEWLLQEVGRVMFGKPNPQTFNHSEQQQVNNVVQRGVRQFYMPDLTPLPHHRGHRWSFMRPTTTLTTSAPYSTGTIAIASGVVTLTSGTFPSWAASGELVVSGLRYTVNTRDSGTQVTLDDTSVTVASGTSYRLEQTIYSLPSDFGGMLGNLTYQEGNTLFYGPVEITDEERIRRLYQDGLVVSSHPYQAAIYPASYTAASGTQWLIRMWPSPDAAYVLEYRYKSNPSALSASQYPMGGVEHYETVLASCLAVADPAVYRTLYLEKLASSIELDQSEHVPPRLGVNLDRGQAVENEFAWGFRNPSGQITVNGTVY